VPVKDAIIKRVVALFVCLFRHWSAWSKQAHIHKGEGKEFA